MHRALADAGYVDSSGALYAEGRLEVDLLVPSGTDEFVTGATRPSASPERRIPMDIRSVFNWLPARDARI